MLKVLSYKIKMADKQQKTNRFSNTEKHVENCVFIDSLQTLNIITRLFIVVFFN